MSERGVIARHAGTVLAGQLATMAFGVTDTIVAGRYSHTEYNVSFVVEAGAMRDAVAVVHDEFKLHEFNASTHNAAHE